MVDSMRSRRLLLALLLLLLAAAAAAAGGSGMTREQHMKAKRAFDRAKHGLAVNEEDADDRIEYKAADGSTKTMSKAELDAILRQQQQGGQPQVGPDGSLSKQKEGKATVEELREKDPFLARVVDAAKYAFSRLQAEGAVGQKARLKSLHSIDDENDQGLEEDPKELHLRLIVADGDADRTIEVRLTRGYLSAVVEVTGSGTKRPIPISLRPPSDPSASSSPWELLRAYSPVPPTLLLASAGVAVLLMGIALVALGGGFGKGGSGGKAD